MNNFANTTRQQGCRKESFCSQLASFLCRVKSGVTAIAVLLLFLPIMSWASTPPKLSGSPESRFSISTTISSGSIIEVFPGDEWITLFPESALYAGFIDNGGSLEFSVEGVDYHQISGIIEVAQVSIKSSSGITTDSFIVKFVGDQITIVNID